MNVTSVTNYFRPRLEVTPDLRATNTTGDVIEPSQSLMIPKSRAELGNDDQGREFIAVARGQDVTWVPKDAFYESPGENGMFYLPTYKDSVMSAALGGGMRGLIALGPLGAVAGAVGGVVGTKAGDHSALKLGAGSLAGAATLAAGHALLFGAQGLPVAAFLGAVSGLGATAAGAGDASVRDAVYGGSIAGFAATMVTGMPLAILTGAASSALGSQANSTAGKVLTGAAAGAFITVAQAALTGGPLGLAAGIGAAVGAAGPLLGLPLMQLSRNLTDDGAKVVRKVAGGWIKEQNETTLKVLMGVPFAASFGLIGSAASALNPSWGTAGAVLGTVAGGVLGFYQGHKMIEGLKARQKVAA